MSGLSNSATKRPIGKWGPEWLAGVYNINKMTPAQVKDSATTPGSRLDPKKIGKMWRYKLKAIKPEVFAAMEASQTRAIKPRQIPHLRTAQMQQINTGHLSVPQVKRLTGKQIKIFSEEQISKFGAGAIGAFKTKHIKALTTPPEKNQIGAIDPAAWKGVKPNQINKFSKEQLSFVTGDQFKNIDPKTLRKMSSSRLNSISPDAIAKMTGPQARALKPSRIAKMKNEQVAKFTAVALNSMHKKQLRSIKPEAVAGISPTEIGKMDGKQMRKWGGQHFKNFTGDQIGEMKAGQLNTLSGKQLRSLKEPDKISDTALMGMDKKKIKQLSPNLKSMNPLTRSKQGDLVKGLLARRKELLVKDGATNKQSKYYPDNMKNMSVVKLRTIKANDIKHMDEKQLNALSNRSVLTKAFMKPSQKQAISDRRQELGLSAHTVKGTVKTAVSPAVKTTVASTAKPEVTPKPETTPKPAATPKPKAEPNPEFKYPVGKMLCSLMPKLRAETILKMEGVIENFATKNKLSDENVKTAINLAFPPGGKPGIEDSKNVAKAIGKAIKDYVPRNEAYKKAGLDDTQVKMANSVLDSYGKGSKVNMDSVVNVIKENPKIEVVKDVKLKVSEEAYLARSTEAKTNALAKDAKLKASEEEYLARSTEVKVNALSERSSSKSARNSPGGP